MEEERYLVKKAKRGDAEAFAMLYEQIYKRLYQFALYTLKNTQDAEDAVSDTVADAFASIRKLRSEEAFSSWMFRILANKCNRKMREYYNRRQESEISEWENSADKRCVAAGVAAQGSDRGEGSARRTSVSEAEWDHSNEEYFDVRKTFFELSDEERMIVGLHQFFGYTTREIAEFLHMNENTVRSKESRAIRKMGSKLKGLR